MSTAMYSGASGIKSQQTRLDVIGNNIANISTAGYKSQRVNFNDILSQTLSNANGPSASSGRGGTNPMQIGLGVSVGSIDTDMSTGSTQSTGSTRDVSIGGDGFFIVKGSGGEYEFTRAGNFGVDKQGNLTVNGLKVCGWQKYTTDADGKVTYDTQTTVEPINIFSDSINGNKRIIPPKASATGTVSGNLDPTKTARGTSLTNIGTVPSKPDSLTTLTVYDAEGNSYDIQVKMSKCYTDASTSGTTKGSVVLATGGYTVTAGSNDKLVLAVDGGASTEITIPAGTYATSSAFVDAVNTGINNSTELSGKVKAQLTPDGKLSFVSTSTGAASTGVTITDGTDPSGALAAYMGTVTSTPGSVGISGKATGNTDLTALTYPYTVTAGSKDTITLAVDGGTPVQITIPPGTYANATALAAAVNAGITGSSLNTHVTAGLDGTGKHLEFTSATTGTSSKVTVTDGTNPSGALAKYVGTTSTTGGITNSGNTSWFWQAVPSSSNIAIGKLSSGYLEFDSKGKLITTDANFNTTPTITLTPTNQVGAAPLTLKLDMSGISTYTSSSESKVTAATDGYAAGDLNDFSIGSDGVITGSYSNGQKQPVGMIALAKFANSGGLEKVGNNLYKTTVNSGNFTGGVEAGSNGTGTLSPGTLEGSNVDLAQQFSDMMITQRAYQANSKIITTSDSMMETLINMVR